MPSMLERLLEFIQKILFRSIDILCSWIPKPPVRPQAILQTTQSPYASPTHLRPASNEPSNARDKTSRKLLDLPPELRSMIWATVFSFDGNGDNDEIDLLSAARPDAALLRVCRQVREETEFLYKIASNRYWGGKFTLTLPSPAWTATEIGEVRSQLTKFPDGFIQTVCRLVIRRHDNVHGHATFTFDTGVWSGEMDELHYYTPPSRAVFVPQIDPVIRLPQHGRISLHVFDDDAPRPVLTFMQFSHRIKAGEVHKIAGWKALTKREIIGAVRWFQEWG